MKKTHILLIFILSIQAYSYGQGLEAAGGTVKEQPLARVSFIALGSAPKMTLVKATKADSDRILSEVGGAGVEESLEGSYVVKQQPKGTKSPPGVIAPVNLEQKKAGMKEKFIPIALNRFRGMHEVYAGAPQGLYLENYDSEKDKQGAPTLYFTLPALEPKSESIFFLIPTGKGKTLWVEKPKLHRLSLNDETVAGKSIVVKNMSKEKIRVSVGKKSVDLKPGELQGFEEEYSDKISVKMGAYSDGILGVNQKLRMVDGTTSVLVVVSSGVSLPKVSKIKMFKVMTKRAKLPEEKVTEVIN